VHVRPDHPQRIGFAYPPASEAQLLVIEEALGFPLPLLLWTLNAEIANCGFGPDAGIQGALVGYGTCIDEPVSTIVADYVWHRQVGNAQMGRHDSVQLVDLADYAHQWKQSPCGKSLLLLPYAVWPEQLLSLEDLGCCQQACLDCGTGHVLRTATGASDDEYEVGLLNASKEFLRNKQYLCGSVSDY
jgi:hypothetical protein